MGAAVTWFPFARVAGTPAARRAAAVLASAALVALAAWWRAAGPASAPVAAPEVAAPAPPSGGPPAPLLEVQGSRLVGSDEAGRRLWDLDAEGVQVDRKRRTVDVTGPRGRWYEDGKVAAVFEAPRGRYLADAGVIDLDGGVTATTADGRTIRARRIRWDLRRGTVQAWDGVVLSQPGAVIRADRLSADAALSTVTLQGRVTITVER